MGCTSISTTSVLIFWTGIILLEGLQAAWVLELFLHLRLPSIFSRDFTGSIYIGLHLLLQVPFEETNLQEDDTGVNQESAEP